MRQQRTRQIEDDEASRKTTYKTQIEISHDVFAPSEKDVKWADGLVVVRQAKARKRAERLKEGAEEIEDDFAYEKKDGKTKQSRWRRSEDDEDNNYSSCSSSEEHEKGYPKRRLRKERRVIEQAGKAIDTSMRVGQLVTAVEDFTGWEGPETRLSFSKLSLNRC
jgi:hypothetical protein